VDWSETDWADVRIGPDAGPYPARVSATSPDVLLARAAAARTEADRCNTARQELSRHTPQARAENNREHLAAQDAEGRALREYHEAYGYPPSCAGCTEVATRRVRVEGRRVAVCQGCADAVARGWTLDRDEE
jgi:hypothetical protein